MVELDLIMIYMVASFVILRVNWCKNEGFCKWSLLVYNLLGETIMHTGVIVIDVADFWPCNFIGISKMYVIQWKVVFRNPGFSGWIVISRIVKRDAIGLQVSQHIT